MVAAPFLVVGGLIFRIALARRRAASLAAGELRGPGAGPASRSRLRGSATLKRLAALPLLAIAASHRSSPALRSSTASSPASRRTSWRSSLRSGLTEEGLSISLLEISPAESAAGSLPGDAAYYPASVVKIFYLAYYEAQKQRGS